MKQSAQSIAYPMQAQAGTSASLLPWLRREAQLLVWCARTAIDQAVQTRIHALVSEPVNWAVVLDLAKFHGVVPMLYRTLLSVCPNALPGEVREMMRRQVQAGALLNQVLADELITLVDSFAAKGISVIPVKGPTLALSAYRDLSLREFDDLDFIVEQPSIPHARQILWALGYQLLSQDAPGLDATEEAFHCFAKRNWILKVDLQSVMARRLFAFKLDRPELWKRLRPIACGDKTIMGLSSEDLLIILCVHGSKHAWEQLKWVCDVAELIRNRRGMDWSRVLYQAREWRCRRMVLLGLALANRLFQVDLPAAVSREVTLDPDLKDLTQRMPKTLLLDARGGVDETDAEVLYLTLKDTHWERWRYALALCHAEVPALSKPLAWSRWQGALQRLYRLVHPLHQCVATYIPSLRLRKLLVGWLEPTG